MSDVDLTGPPDATVAGPTGLGSRRWLRRTGWATLVANAGLVVTGGAVRLTGSGLGCPTWPRCTEDSFTPHGAMDLHEAIEFGNRMLTFVLVAVAVLTFVSAVRSRRSDLRGLALLMALGIPSQAVIGGITVLTGLNPWVVSFHLLVSLAIVCTAVLFLDRIDRPSPVRGHEPRGRTPRAPLAPLAWTTFAAAWVVLYLGTVVTGSGPHAGDAAAPRNGLDPLQLSQLHADSVFAFFGLSLALWLVLRSARFAGPDPAAWAAAKRAATWLLVAELAQGTVGFVQYFTNLPEILVGIHMLGAALIAALVTAVLLRIQRCL